MAFTTRRTTGVIGSKSVAESTNASATESATENTTTATENASTATETATRSRD